MYCRNTTLKYQPVAIVCFLIVPKRNNFQKEINSKKEFKKQVVLDSWKQDMVSVYRYYLFVFCYLYFVVFAYLLTELISHHFRPI